MQNSQPGVAYFQSTEGGPWTPLGTIETDGIQIKPTPPTAINLKTYRHQAALYAQSMPAPRRIAGTDYRVAYLPTTHEFELWRGSTRLGTYPAEYAPTPRHLLKAFGIYRLPGDAPLIHDGKTPR